MKSNQMQNSQARKKPETGRKNSRSNDRSRTYTKSRPKDKSRSYDRDKGDFDSRDTIKSLCTDQYLGQVEGRNPVNEAIKAGRSINKIYLTKGRDRRDGRLQEIVEAAKAGGAVIMEVEREVLDKMAEGTGHQGIIAQLSAKDYVDPYSFVEDLRDQGKEGFILILDHLQDGYNFGSIIRIAEAAGVDLIVIPERRSVAVDGHVAKASAGAVEFVPIGRVTNISDFIDWLKEGNYWVFGSEVEGAEDFHQAHYKGSIALVIGNEGKGMAANIRKRCDFLVTIPMQGQINSLNAAVATGIIVFEAARQRRGG